MENTKDIRDLTSYDVIVLGAGPAGLTAGIYLGRARQRVLIVDPQMAGGQVILSHAIANYPGVAETTGRALAKTMRSQAISFGCKVIDQSEIEKMDLAGDIKSVTVEDDGTFTAKAVILAVGGVPRTLGLESEQRFKGLGISYCATCDGDFFTGHDIVAIGGGNSALEEAVSLTRYANTVTIIHEFDHFQAQAWIVEEARANPKIRFLMNQRIKEFVGEDTLKGVVSEDKATGQVNTTPATGAFVFIGYVPATKSFNGIVDLSDRGEIVTDENLMTSLPGVFSAGDARVKRHRQITTAVADGTMAAMNILDYLGSLKV